MTASNEASHLSANHRDTLLQIFQHPTSHNIEWHAVLSLLEAVGEVDERQGREYSVALGGEVPCVRRAPPQGR